jgi:hypothetical protein
MATEWNRFVSDDPPFSLRFPVEWRLAENGDAFGLEAPDDDVALTITRMSSPDGDATPQTIKLLLDTFSEGRPLRAAPQWLSSEEWNGVEAELGPATHEQPLSHWLLRAVCHGSRVYVNTVTGPRDDVERNRETCLQIMNSLRLRHA